MSQPICLTTETACNSIASAIDVSAYEGLFSTVQFYTGIDNEVKKSPCVICAAIDAQEEAPDTGIYHVKTQIIVKERAATANRETTTLADTIFRGFLTGSIEQSLSNNATNYFVYKVFQPDPQQSGLEGKQWVATLNLHIVCCITQ
jgi:hypothetical protein